MRPSRPCPRARLGCTKRRPSPEIRWQLLCSFEIVKFDKGAVIVHEGALSNDGAYVLLAGAAEVFKQMPRDESSGSAGGGAAAAGVRRAGEAAARSARWPRTAPTRPPTRRRQGRRRGRGAAGRRGARLGTSVAMLEPGAIFGEVALSMGWKQARTASVVAAGETNLNAVLEDTLHENGGDGGAARGLAEPGGVEGGASEAGSRARAAARGRRVVRGAGRLAHVHDLPPHSARERGRLPQASERSRRLALVAACRSSRRSRSTRSTASPRRCAA